MAWISRLTYEIPDMKHFAPQDSDKLFHNKKYRNIKCDGGGKRKKLEDICIFESYRQGLKAGSGGGEFI